MAEEARFITKKEVFKGEEIEDLHSCQTACR